MRFDEALHILADRDRRSSRQLVQAARVILAAQDARETQRAAAFAILGEIRKAMWHADKAPPYTPSHLALVNRRPHDLASAAAGLSPDASPGRLDVPWRMAVAFVKRYKASLIDLSSVAAASALALYLGLTFNIFSDAPGHPQAAEVLELDELLLFLAVLLLGSLWAIHRLQTQRRAV